MIFLAVTPLGLADALAVATTTDAVWCGADAISETDYAALAARPSRFSYSLSGEGAQESIADALETIEEHHPGQRIWVETAPSV
jgi:hypothetical protein